jgi:hypothetical protein
VGKALSNGINAFINKTLKSSFTPPAMTGHREKIAIYESESKPSTYTKFLVL